MELNLTLKRTETYTYLDIIHSDKQVAFTVGINLIYHKLVCNKGGCQITLPLTFLNFKPSYFNQPLYNSA